MCRYSYAEKGKDAMEGEGKAMGVGLDWDLNDKVEQRKERPLSEQWFHREAGWERAWKTRVEPVKLTRDPAQNLVKIPLAGPSGTGL